MDEVAEVQWKVTWFPDDAAQRAFTGTEHAVRRRAREVAGFHPIIESRQIGPWVIEES